MHSMTFAMVILAMKKAGKTGVHNRWSFILALPRFVELFARVVAEGDLSAPKTERTNPSAQGLREEKLFLSDLKTSRDS